VVSLPSALAHPFDTSRNGVYAAAGAVDAAIANNATPAADQIGPLFTTASQLTTRQIATGAGNFAGNVALIVGADGIGEAGAVGEVANVERIAGGAGDAAALGEVAQGARGVGVLGDVGDAPSLVATYQAKYASLYEEGLIKVQGDIASGELVNATGQPAHLFEANEIDDYARTGLRDFALERGDGPDVVRINQRLYLDTGKYRIPDVYFPESGTILDGTLGTKTASTSQIRDFTAANGGAPIIIVRPQAYGGSYTIPTGGQ
jgi:hypothetical protein